MNERERERESQKERERERESRAPGHRVSRPRGTGSVGDSVGEGASEHGSERACKCSSRKKNKSP